MDWQEFDRLDAAADPRRPERGGRPNTDAAGQCLRAAAVCLVAAFLALAIGTAPHLDRATRVAVDYAVPSVLVSAAFVLVVALSAPRRWDARRYLFAVATFAALVAAALALAGRTS